MGRYTPSVQQISALEGLAGGIDAVADERDRRRDLRLEEQERAQQAEDRDLDRQLAQLQLGRGRAELHATGYRDTAPTVQEEPETPDIFQGQRPSFGAHGPDPEVPNLFAEQRPSAVPLPGPRQPLSSGRPAQGDGGSMVSALDGLAAQGRPRRPRLIALPGAYVRGRGFTERALTDLDLANEQAEQALSPDMRMGMQTDAPPSAQPGGRRAYLETPTRETVDPNFEPVSGGGFMDRRQTPEARKLRAEDDDYTREVDRLEGVLTRLRKGGRAQAEALAAGLSYDDVFPEEEEPDDIEFTADELRGAGVPERAIGAALRDPTLARQLVAEYNQTSKPSTGETGPKPPVRGTPEYMKMLEDEARARGANAGSNSEQARMARALSPLMEDAVKRLSEMDTPDLRQKIAAKGFLGFGNYLNSPEGRLFKQASLQFLSSALSITSGKTVSEQEVERTNAYLVPQAGDDAATTDAKLRAMGMLATSARVLGGLQAADAGGGSGVGDVAPAFSDDPEEAAAEALEMMERARQEIEAAQRGGDR